MYKVGLKGFPKEVVEKMLDRQEEQGDERDISVFERNKISGFGWRQTIEGYDFWKRVIIYKNFDLFFSKYPKQSKTMKAKLTIETAKKLFNEGGAGKLFALDNYTKEQLTKKEVTKSWKDLKVVEGFYINEDSGISLIKDFDIHEDHKNVFPTKQDAKSTLALAQLLQLRKAVVGDWVPDWGVDDSAKYCIYRYSNQLTVNGLSSSYEELSFPTKEMAEDFLNNHRELIEIYFKLK